MAGKEAVFKCTVHEIKVKELPELDDEFAAEVSEFDTLDAYKADIKAKIKEQKIAEGKRQKEDQAVEKAVANATMEIPEAMIDTQVQQMVQEFSQRMQSQGLTMEQYFQFTGLTADKMLEEMRPQAVKRIETRLVLEAIAKAENIEITDEKIVNRMSGRRVCESCGKPYHLVNCKPKTDGVCDDCNGTLVQRKDDHPDTVLARLAVYHKETEPLVDYYNKQGKLVNVEGSDNVEVTKNHILEKIEA